MTEPEPEAPRAPLPPFDVDGATRKMRRAEDAWNAHDPARVSLACSPNSAWRHRAEFLTGRAVIVEFLIRKWKRELAYPLIKELWTFHENRIAVRFAYEWHDAARLALAEFCAPWPAPTLASCAHGY